jgi:hypothetical protein
MKEFSGQKPAKKRRKPVTKSNRKEKQFKGKYLMQKSLSLRSLLTYLSARQPWGFMVIMLLLALILITSVSPALGAPTVIRVYAQ